MKQALGSIISQIASTWRRDRALLWPLAGLFLFLPQYAVLLLIPEMPANPPGGTMETWSKALEPWASRYFGWFVVAYLVAQYGALSVVSLYARPQLPMSGAMGRAARLFPRSVLATMLVTMPCAMLALLSLGIPFASIFVVPAIVYALARTVLTGAVIVGSPGSGAAAAVVRSWRLTRGAALPAALLVGAVVIGGQAIAGIVVAIARGLAAGPFGNPVLIAMIDAAAAGVTCAAALALALLQVVLYRRLAR